MKKAYIGISGPLGYDYNNQFEKINKDEYSSPNPIIENAMGILLFFDEIVFACPQVCPRSMRKLDYVKFLSEMPNFDDKIKIINKKIENLNLDLYQDLSEKLSNNRYGTAIKKMLGSSVSFTALDTTSKFLIDYHTHDLYLTKDEWIRASSYDIRSWLFDMEVIKEFKLLEFDPIFNSNTSAIADSLEEKYKETHKLSNELIIKRIPNYINENGPYHPSIEELRNHKFISEFRQHLDEIMKNSSSTELSRIADEVEKSADDIRKKVFMKYMNNFNSYLGLAKAAGSDIAGFFIPGISTATEIAERFKRERERKGMKWAAFLTDLDNIKQNIN